MEVPEPNVKPFSSERRQAPQHNKFAICQNDPFDFPPGYRFCPYDHELILYYLKRKVMNLILPHNKIQEVNLYKYSPEELSGKYPTLGEKEWYFFTPRDRKYKNGTRPNRAAGSGYWKATGADRLIKYQIYGVIGYRKALVYYEGRPPKGHKTNWIMHEYRVKEDEATTSKSKPRPKPPCRDGVDSMRLDEWVLCRIYKKADKSKCTRKDENFETKQPFSPSHPQPHGEESVPEPIHPSNDAIEFGKPILPSNDAIEFGKSILPSNDAIEFGKPILPSNDAVEFGKPIPPSNDAIEFGKPILPFTDAIDFGDDSIYNEVQSLINYDSLVLENIYIQQGNFNIDDILISSDYVGGTF